LVGGGGERFWKREEKMVSGRKEGEKILGWEAEKLERLKKNEEHRSPESMWAIEILHNRKKKKRPRANLDCITKEGEKRAGKRGREIGLERGKSLRNLRQ